MLTDIQTEYLCRMPEARLIEYLQNKATDEQIQTALSSLDNFLKRDTLPPELREKCETALSIVRSHANGIIQGEKSESEESVIEEEDWIDTSQFKPMTSADLIEILGLTIKKDNENKLITFLGMLSAYTKDAQFNISFNAPSSSGKSYIPTEIANLFPSEDVIEVGYCSPTAFFHDKSKAYDKKTNELIVDFTGKIIIFLDQPHTLLLQHLRPLLSHDKPEIRLKITDKSQKGGLRTKNVLLRGFPAVIFCTAGLTLDEQESTRFILLSPEINQEKIREAVIERIRKAANSFAYTYKLEKNEARKILKDRIRAIKTKQTDQVVIKNPNTIEQKFFEKVKMLKPRHQRDMGRIMSLIKIFALLNVWFREHEGLDIIASEDDINAAFDLWSVISEAQELNLPPYVFTLYKEIILKAYEEKNIDELAFEPRGISRQEILNKHLSVYGRTLSDWTLRKEIIPALVASGLIFQEPDTTDKRKMLIYPTTASTISKNENNSGTEGVGTDEELSPPL